MIIKTRKQGNSIILTVPSNFNIPAGVSVEPKLTPTGIYYEFVENDDGFWNFSTEILKDLVQEGLSGKVLIAEFENRKKTDSGCNR